jgi:hypothetical protein
MNLHFRNPRPLGIPLDRSLLRVPHPFSLIVNGWESTNFNPPGPSQPAAPQAPPKAYV